MEEDTKKKSLKKWGIINGTCFIGTFISMQLASNIWNWLVNMDEYTLGISMIFLFPLLVATFCLALLVLAIITTVFAFISMRNIVKEYKENKKMVYSVFGIEIILYVIYILNYFVI